MVLGLRRLYRGRRCPRGRFFGNVFVWVFDRAENEMIVDGDAVVPSSLVTVSSEPARGTVASISLPGRRLRIARDLWGDGEDGSRLGVEGSFKGVDIDLTFETEGNTPVGRWTGTVAGYDFEGVGVAEEHLARW